jgi:hypothetical protein
LIHRGSLRSTRLAAASHHILQGSHDSAREALGGAFDMISVIVCLVCKHPFSWRIAPLERVCSQCGSLHVLKSGIWELKARGDHAEAPVVVARRQHTARVALMKVLPKTVAANERRSK